MKLENPKIKDNITIVDKISAIESIVSYYFTDGEYTPYYAEIAKVNAIAMYFLDGVVFDENDYIYELVKSDEGLSSLVDKFLNQDGEYVDIMDDVMRPVYDMVEFNKQKLIHNTDIFHVIGEMCESVVDTISSLSGMSQIVTPENIVGVKKFMDALKNGDITEENISNAVRQAADQFKMPENEIIEGQRQRIAEQQEILTKVTDEVNELRVKIREYEARNVKSDKKQTVQKSTKSTGKSTGRKRVKKETDPIQKIVNIDSRQ